MLTGQMVTGPMLTVADPMSWTVADPLMSTMSMAARQSYSRLLSPLLSPRHSRRRPYLHRSTSCRCRSSTSHRLRRWSRAETCSRSHLQHSVSAAQNTTTGRGEEAIDLPYKQISPHSAVSYCLAAQGPRMISPVPSFLLLHSLLGRQMPCSPQHAWEPGHCTLLAQALPSKP